MTRMLEEEYVATSQHEEYVATSQNVSNAQQINVSLPYHGVRLSRVFSVCAEQASAQALGAENCASFSLAFTPSA